MNENSFGSVATTIEDQNLRCAFSLPDVLRRGGSCNRPVAQRKRHHPLRDIVASIIFANSDSFRSEMGGHRFGRRVCWRRQAARTDGEPWNGDFRDNYFAGGAFSRRLARFWSYFSIEAEIGTGGRFGSVNAGEVWGAIYFRYDGFPWNRFVYTTLAVSTGLNYLSKLPPSETHPGNSTSHVLHYFSPEITFAHPQHKQHELLVRYHHRSGVFSTFNGVWGGSNVIALGYRYRYD